MQTGKLKLCLPQENLLSIKWYILVVLRVHSFYCSPIWIFDFLLGAYQTFDNGNNQYTEDHYKHKIDSYSRDRIRHITHTDFITTE